MSIFIRTEDGDFMESTQFRIRSGRLILRWALTSKR